MEFFFTLPHMVSGAIGGETLYVDHLITLLEFLRLMKTGRLFLSILGDITYTRE